jgi:hypothetical protein
LKIEDFEFDTLAEDVAPFLITQEQAIGVVKFRQFWEEVELE